MRGLMMILLLFSLHFLNHAKAENFLVSVQSHSQQEMDLLTDKVDQDLQNSHSSMRQTLGAIEATMSRVVDVDSEFFVAPALSVPTWALLKDISYNVSASEWSFEYQTMRAEPGTLNQFHRVLYFTKQGVAEIGDVDNECLQASISTTDCFTYLQNTYTVAEALNDPSVDYIEYLESDDIKTELEGDETSLLQTLKITIPHTRIRNGQTALAKKETYDHPTLGTQTQWTFGIGMLFHGVGNSMVIFDTFNLIENSFEQLAISRTNTYSLARHVSFWTEQVQYDTSIRIATVEYFLSPGYQVETIAATLNDGEVTTAECTDMQAKIDGLVDKSCLYTHQLCVPNVLLQGDSGDLVSFAIPLPARAGNNFKVNTLLNLKDVATNHIVMSTLNFKTEATPQDVCSTPQTETFDPSSHVQVNLYKGHSLEVQHVDGTFTIQNISDDALGLPDALLTLVLSPKDATADTYFQDFSDEVVQLDELYITHALQDSTLIPSVVNNNITGVPVSGGDTTLTGRSQLQLDAQLLQNCPIEYTWDESVECVTTKDWTLTGGNARSLSSGDNTFYVRRVTFTVEDTQWLQSHAVFINSESATTFLSQVSNLIPDATRRAKSQFYFIFPVYSWYDQSPIGLRDKALVSFAWSVSKTPVTSRRLLEFTENREKHTSKSATGVRRIRKMPSIQVKEKNTLKRPVDNSHAPSSTFELMKKVRALF